MAGIGKALAATPARKVRLPNFVVMTTSPKMTLLLLLLSLWRFRPPVQLAGLAASF
jgi:hypothetical protein